MSFNGTSMYFNGNGKTIQLIRFTIEWFNGTQMYSIVLNCNALTDFYNVYYTTLLCYIHMSCVPFDCHIIDNQTSLDEIALC